LAPPALLDCNCSEAGGRSQTCPARLACVAIWPSYRSARHGSAKPSFEPSLSRRWPRSAAAIWRHSCNLLLKLGMDLGWRRSRFGWAPRRRGLGAATDEETPVFARAGGDAVDLSSGTRRRERVADKSLPDAENGLGVLRNVPIGRVADRRPPRGEGLQFLGVMKHRVTSRSRRALALSN